MQPPPPSTSRRSDAATPSASNTIFLIGFGIFLGIAFLPPFVSALGRLLGLLAIVAMAGALTNPSDYSFAVWVSAQDNVRVKNQRDGQPAGVKQWVSAVVKTAIAAVKNEKLTWTSHNLLVFSVVYVHTLNRYAFGCAGSWVWADKYPTLRELCKAPWIVRYTRGGVESGIEHYAADLGISSTPPSSSTSSSPLYRRRDNGDDDRLHHRHVGQQLEGAATAFASSMFELAGTLSSGGSSQGRQSGLETATGTGIADRELRTRAMKAKIERDWRDAARLFMEASSVASSLLNRANYKLEAAWCRIEDASTLSHAKSSLGNLVNDTVEELASSGYFDEAGRALSELALRLKRRFPADLVKEEAARELATLYLRAKMVFEAGDNTRAASENALRAAAIYTEGAMWKMAEECFEKAGSLQLQRGDGLMADESYSNAVLCRIGQLDVAGAEQLAQRYRRSIIAEHNQSAVTEMDQLIGGIMDAYDKMSVKALDDAIARYETRKRLVTWQRKCLLALKERMSAIDLR
ncbi:hypothetical protein PINS_up003937 [Pythium insidiosum]|nr:hypothetical protein PINS_up003937 [Pythium insidiosum]